MPHPIAYPPEAPLARGWNTWNTRSVLSHVLLPDGLALNLSFCHFGMLAVVTDAFFGAKNIGATAGVRLSGAAIAPRQIRIEPGPHAYDGSYTRLAVVFGDVTLTVETAHAGPDDLVILVTAPAATLKPPALVVEAALLWNHAGHVVHAGPQRMRAEGASGRREIHCTAAAVDEPYLAIRAPSWVVPLTGPVGVATGASRTLEEIAALIAAARDREAATHARYGELADAHRVLQLCCAWDTIYDPLHRRVVTTVSRPWNVLRLGYGVFCWDTFFTAWLIGLDAPALGRACALEAFREMVDGEFVPNVANGSGRRSWDRSQPCVGGLCVLALHELAPDRGFLETVWPALLAWNRWWHRARRNAHGLLSWGSHPATPRIGDLAEVLQPNTPRGAALESGLDNSPMYDDVPLQPGTHLMAQSDVGLVSLYITDCQALAVLARALGRADEARELEGRAAAYAAALEQLWNADAGIYQNRRTDTGAFNPRMSPTSFYPLLAGVGDATRAAQLVRRHLPDERTFWGEWVLPSATRDDPAYPEQLYQRGRVWAPVNFLVYLGLKRAGQHAAAAELTRRSVELLMRNWRRRRGVFENYSAITGDGLDEAYSDPLYTWSGLLALMGLMESGVVPLPGLLRGNAS